MEKRHVFTHSQASLGQCGSDWESEISANRGQRECSDVSSSIRLEDKDEFPHDDCDIIKPQRILLPVEHESQRIQNELTLLLGRERRKSELRQLGGLMVVLGIGAAFSTFSLICSIVEGMAGYSQVEGYSLPVLVGNILQMVCGMTGMATGMICVLVAPQSEEFHTWVKCAVAVINLGPITFVITLIRLIQGADDPPELNQFIPLSLNPTQADIRCCVAMGVLALISVCASLVGGLTVLGLHICAILGKQPHSRHRAYHTIRLTYYSFIVLLGGLSQASLGIHLWRRFGFGPYKEPVHVATYTIHFPCLAVLVGTLQCIFGMYGFRRARGTHSKLCKEEKFDASFLKLTGVTWIVSTLLQFVFQPAYDDGITYNAEGATVASVYLGFFVMPALLDYLVQTTPVHPRPEYYGLPSDAPYKEDLLVKWLRMTPLPT